MGVSIAKNGEETENQDCHDIYLVKRIKVNGRQPKACCTNQLEPPGSDTSDRVYLLDSAVDVRLQNVPPFQRGGGESVIKLCLDGCWLLYNPA